MQKTQITVTGNVVDEPMLFKKDKDRPTLISFRIASKPRIFDSKKKEWYDGTTSWFDVKARSVLAEHAAASLSKGDPVVVSGIMRTREWESDKGSGSSNLIFADSLGHDLTFGTASFTRGNPSDESIAKAKESDISESFEEEKA
jgi:single-strand DNA-binding protein